MSDRQQCGEASAAAKLASLSLQDRSIYTVAHRDAQRRLFIFCVEGTAGSG
jgi:hypothetical protein